MSGLAALRASIEDRIDSLEAFYNAHLDDERSLLFEKQRLKLRKLLHEYDAAVASISASSAAPASHQQQGGNDGSYGALGRGGARFDDYGASAAAAAGQSAAALTAGGGATRVIREDSRLSLTELSAWFAQAGAREMPEVTLAIVERVWTHLTRTNVDGKMSVRDLRQWYISFGKRALGDGLQPSDLERELIPSKFLFQSRSTTQGTGPKLHNSSAAKGARPFSAAPQTGSSSSSVAQAPPSSKVLYPWEQQAAEAAALGASTANLGSAALGSSGVLASGGAGSAALGSGSGSGSLGLPNHMLEFQLRLTPKEYEAMCLRRRQLEAEQKYRERVAKARAAAGHGEDGQHGAQRNSGLLDKGPYQEPTHAAAVLYRST